MPIRCPVAVPILRRAIETIPGLRGFVGVDYVWEPTRREVTILEINPRPTTSYVGFRLLLPPGCLAGAWLAACGADIVTSVRLPELSELVGRQSPVRFDARGCVQNEEIGEPFP